ncbi:MAG: stage II sporulation protein P [Oscillospiraceae bacterium]|nr:stage II sporulation protein P [Oscillospiraceae bacterium]
MDNDRRILQICTAVLLGAVILRLLSGPLGTAAQKLDTSDIATALLFLQTGRVVRLADTPQQPLPEETQPLPTENPQKKPWVFTPADADLIACNSYSGHEVDVAALLAQPLDWKDPGILILHTHATESYRNTEGYMESSDYRTLDEKYNMLSVGSYLAKLLSGTELRVHHDTTLHDYPSYNGSYENSRKTAQTCLQEDADIELILDLHRDAMVDSLGNQIGYTVDTDSGAAAKVMLVVGVWNENWQENMALAVKLHARLEQLCPGICRPISLRGSRFNQDLSAGALLIEVGAAGNTRAEALRATEILAEAIISLSAGAVYEE